MKVYVIGAGKVGRGLTHALRAARVQVTLRKARSALPNRPIVADLVVLAVRDTALPELVKALSDGRLDRRAAVVHVAGALAPDVLAPLRPLCAGVGQAHPMVSFASPDFHPSLRGAHLLATGDPIAVARARWMARRLGMVARTFRSVDRTSYHAAAGLVANGAAALAAGGARLLSIAGCPREEAAQLLGPLLRSVAENVQALGLPEALTGPVRRGDARAVMRHLDAIGAYAPDLAELYRACAGAQLPLARELGDAPRQAFDDVEKVLARGKARHARGRPRNGGSRRSQATRRRRSTK